MHRDRPKRLFGRGKIFASALSRRSQLSPLLVVDRTETPQKGLTLHDVSEPGEVTFRRLFQISFDSPVDARGSPCAHADVGTGRPSPMLLQPRGRTPRSSPSARRHPAHAPARPKAPPSLLNRGRGSAWERTAFAWLAGHRHAWSKFVWAGGRRLCAASSRPSSWIVTPEWLLEVALQQRTATRGCAPSVLVPRERELPPFLLIDVSTLYISECHPKNFALLKTRRSRPAACTVNESGPRRRPSRAILLIVSPD
jgi:hypothetical protein